MTVVYRSRAPLRISFAGGGSDISPYPEKFGGAVLSTTIDLFSYSSIRLINKNTIQIHSLDFDKSWTIKNHTDMQKDNKLQIIKSIFQNLDKKIRGLEITLFSDTRIGSGLGASSAFTVALLGNLLKIYEIMKTTNDIAKLAYKIERLDCGIKGGYQDQYSATFGGFNFIEFNKNSVKVNPLKLSQNLLDELLGNLVLCDTKIKRKDLVYDKIITSQQQITNQNESGLEHIHRIKQLAFEMKKSLLRGNLDEFSNLLHHSWMEKKHIDHQITTKKIDKIYKTALASGAKGGKLLGAGGGGYLLLYCDMEKKINVTKNLEKLGCSITKFNFENRGLTTWLNNAGHTS